MGDEEQKNKEIKKEDEQKPLAKDEESNQISAEECAEIKDRALRLAAEFDNYKKRSRAEMEQAKGIGKAELLRNLLPVLDEFELALIATSGSKDENLVKGISLLCSNFKDALKREGLSEIPADGIFDPYRHEIIMVKEDPKKPGTILSVVKKGYIFNGIMIRPSSVIVAKEKETDDKKDDAKK